MDIISKKVRDNLINNNIRNKSILIGFSGGKDSSALLDVLIKLSSELNLKIYAAYVNHNLRKDSDKEEKFNIKRFKKYKIKFFKLIINKKIWIKRINESIEMTARRMRYDFFIKTILKNNIDLIATAHNLNDKIETFFINIFRASGVESLRSIRMKNKNIIRPLINTSREEINDYILNNNIDHYEDYTNHQNKFKRNIIRNKIIPVFSSIHSDYIKSFEHVFSFLNEEYSFLNKIALKKIKKIMLYKNKSLCIIDYKSFIKSDTVIKKLIIKKILKFLSVINCLNLILLNEITIKKNVIKYENKQILIKGSSRHLFIINKKSISENIDFKILKVSKLPFNIKTNYQEINIMSSDNDNYKNAFMFKIEADLFPLKLRKISKNDCIYTGINIKQNIKQMLKDMKIPEIIHNNTIVIINKFGCIIGFMLYNIYRTSYNFFITDKKDEKAVINLK